MLQVSFYYLRPSTCALSAIFYGFGAYEMNLVARSLVPILYRCSSVGYTNLSLRISTEIAHSTFPWHLFAQNLGLTAQTL
jgi:hypothetical protein